MIITISGVPGSGKTSVAHILANQLDMKFYSIGALRGKMAMDRGMTIAELNALGEKDPMTDTSVDDYQKELGQKEDQFVVEGRLSWYFIPHSFKILLLCDPKEAARRVFEAQRSSHLQQDEPVYRTIDEAQTQLAARVASDHTRYRKHYNIENYLDPHHYDLLIDTTKNTGATTTAQQILEEIKNRQLL